MEQTKIDSKEICEDAWCARRGKAWGNAVSCLSFLRTLYDAIFGTTVDGRTYAIFAAILFQRKERLAAMAFSKVQPIRRVFNGSEGQVTEAEGESGEEQGDKA
jgi:hypothetical protein